MSPLLAGSATAYSALHPYMHCTVPLLTGLDLVTVCDILDRMSDKYVQRVESILAVLDGTQAGIMRARAAILASANTFKAFPGVWSKVFAKTAPT